MSQMSQFMTERIHKARIFERLARGRMSKSNPNRAVGIANTISAFHIRALSFEHAVFETKASADQQRIPFQTVQKDFLCATVQSHTPRFESPIAAPTRKRVERFRDCRDVIGSSQRQDGLPRLFS